MLEWRSSAQMIEAPHVVEPHDVVRVLVRQQDRIHTADVVRVVKDMASRGIFFYAK